MIFTIASNLAHGTLDITGKYISKIVLTLKELFAGYSIHGFQLSFSMGLPKLYLSGFFQSDLI